MPEERGGLRWGLPSLQRRDLHEGGPSTLWFHVRVSLGPLELSLAVAGSRSGHWLPRVALSMVHWYTKETTGIPCECL